MILLGGLRFSYSGCAITCSRSTSMAILTFHLGVTSSSGHLCNRVPNDSSAPELSFYPFCAPPKPLSCPFPQTSRCVPEGPGFFPTGQAAQQRAISVNTQCGIRLLLWSNSCPRAMGCVQSAANVCLCLARQPSPARCHILPQPSPAMINSRTDVA